LSSESPRAGEDASRGKRLLVFASKLGYQTRGFAEAAKRLGIALRFVTDRCHQLDDPWGDRAIAAHFEEPESAAANVMAAMSGLEVDGVIALGDRPTVAAAYAARGLGVWHNHPAAVEACRSKERMRQVFREAGLRVPWFRALPLRPVPEPALAGIGFPCVVKPISLSASTGVMRANSREEFLEAAERLRKLLESPEVRATREANLDLMLVEGYIPGKEVAVEGLLTEGTLRVLAIFDKPDPLEGPYFEETIYTTPSRLDEATKRDIEVCARAAVQALGLVHGPVHAEFRVNEGGVWPLEVAARPIGGLCARALRFQGETQATIGLEELILRHAVGLPGAEWPRESPASGVMMIPVPESGVLQEVKGEEAARSTPGITSVEITARLRDFVAAWPEGSSYLGFIFARGESAQAVDDSLRAAHAKLGFTLAPRLAVEHPAARMAARDD